MPVKTPEEFLSLDNAERMAAEASETNVLLVGRPCSGKTTALIGRFFFLVKNGINPKDMIFLVHEEENRAIMESTLQHTLRGSSSSTPSVFTFHGFSEKLLRKTGKKTNRIIDAREQRNIISSIVAGCKKKQLSLIEFFDYWRKRKDGEELKTEEKFFLASLYQTYEDHLKKNNLLDTENVIRLASSMLPPNIRAVLVDDFDELTRNEVTLLSSFGMDVRIMAAGNPEQGEFHKIFAERGARELALKGSYRCAGLAEILLHEPEHEPLHASNTRIHVHTYRDTRAESGGIMEFIREYRDEGKDAEDIRIFLPSLFYSQDIERELTRARIPYRIDGIPFLFRPEVSLLMDVLRLCVTPKDASAFSRLVRAVTSNDMPEARLESIREYMSVQGKSVMELMSELHAENGATYMLEKRHKDVLLSVGERLLALVHCKEEGGGIEDVLSLAYQSLSIRDVIERTSFTESEMEDRKAAALGLIGNARTYEESMKNAGKTPVPERYLWYFDTAADKVQKKCNRGIRISSLKYIGKSVYPAVVIAGIGGMGKEEGDTGRKEEWEEKRLLYAAMTRATERILLTGLTGDYGSYSAILSEIQARTDG